MRIIATSTRGTVHFNRAGDRWLVKRSDSAGESALDQHWPANRLLIDALDQLETDLQYRYAPNLFKEEEIDANNLRG